MYLLCDILVLYSNKIVSTPTQALFISQLYSSAITLFQIIFFTFYEFHILVFCFITHWFDSVRSAKHKGVICEKCWCFSLSTDYTMSHEGKVWKTDVKIGRKLKCLQVLVIGPAIACLSRVATSVFKENIFLISVSTKT